MQRTSVHIFSGFNRFVIKIDDFLVNEEFGTRWEALISGQVMQSVQHCFDVLRKATVSLQFSRRRHLLYVRPHVFSGVNSDSSHSDFGQAIKVSGHDIANVFRRSVLISQKQKPTIAHVVGVLIGVDIA